MMKPLKESRLTIVGTGLMGASLALALRDKVKCLQGVERDPASREIAAPYFDHMTDSLGDALPCTDVLVLATPVKTILHILRDLKTTAPPGLLILDLGSSKQRIVTAMNKLPAGVLAVGGHPMCGKETSGPAEADGGLYWDRAFVLCPTKRSTPEALAFASEIVAAVGARCMVLSAHRHDRAVAAISHLPYVLSAGLVRTVQTQRGKAPDGVAWQLASSGFRDTSRLAGSNVTMMTDTLLSNREAVLDTLATFRMQLAEIERLVAEGNEAQLYVILSSAQQARSAWFKKWTNSS